MTALRRSVLAAFLVAAALTAGIFASGTQQSSIILKVAATNTKTGTLGARTITDPLALDYTQNLASGTGANQASNIFSDQRTLTASSNEDLDLAGTLTNSFGVTLSFTKVKALIIHASSANTNDVLVGGAVANQFATWLNTAADYIIVKPGGTFMLVAPNAAGYAVTAGTGDLLHVANSAGGTSVIYDVVVIGVD